MVFMAEFKYLKQVSTLKVDREKCTGCRVCMDVCPHAVFELQAKKPEVADLDACMECGACIMNCEAQAIIVERGTGCATAYLINRLGDMNKRKATT